MRLTKTRNVGSTGSVIFFVKSKKKFDHSEIIFNIYTKRKSISLRINSLHLTNKQHSHPELIVSQSAEFHFITRNV